MPSMPPLPSGKNYGLQEAYDWHTMGIIEHMFPVESIVEDVSLMKRSAPPLPTREDEALIQDYMLHAVLESVLKRDIRLLPTLELKLADLYALLLRHAGKDNADRLWAARQQMRRRGIRILGRSRTAAGFEIKYLCRGYECMLAFDSAAFIQDLASRIGAVSQNRL